MKITLIEPTRYLGNGKLLKSKKVLVPSLTLPLLAAFLPDEDHVSVVIELFEDINFDEQVDLVGITSYTPSVHRAYEIADEFRRRKVSVVMGGIHVTMESEEALAHADTVIIGEAEETWPQFINDFKKGIPKRVYEANTRPSLAHLPIPRFSLINKRGYLGCQTTGPPLWFLKPVVPIQTARGCPHSCEYCSVTKFSGGRYRVRPVEDVVNEIKSLGIRYCFFVDDNIFASSPRAQELFKALMPLKITWFANATIGAAEDEELIHLARKSGCTTLCIGLESLSCRSLESVGKGINRVEHYEKNLMVYRGVGIGTLVSMMFGFDGEEPAVFEETYKFLVKNRVPYTCWWPLTPLPGTPFYQRLSEHGRLKEEKWWLHPDGNAYELKFTGSVIEPTLFAKAFYDYYRRFYSLSTIAKRLLFPPQQRWVAKLLLNVASRKRITPLTNILEH